MAKTVLVIDNDHGSRDLVDSLRVFGFRVMEEFSSADGLRKAVEERPTVIIIDENMPPIDGVDFLSVIRSFTESLIMVMGTQRTENAAQSLLQGADAHVSRPLNNKQVLLRVQALVRRQPIPSASSF